MAQLTEILQQEKQRTTGETLRQIHLYPEGGFYRAYEWSAWLCVRYVRQLKPTKRMVKSVGAPMVFVGFPQTSLSKFTVEGAEMGVDEPNNHLTMMLPESMFANPVEQELTIDAFERWKDSVPEKPQKGKVDPFENLPEASANLDAMLKGDGASTGSIIQQIMAFPIEQKSPIECMIFVAELKRTIASIL